MDSEHKLDELSKYRLRKLMPLAKKEDIDQFIKHIEYTFQNLKIRQPLRVVCRTVIEKGD